MNISKREFLQVLGAASVAGMGLGRWANADAATAADALYNLPPNMPVMVKTMTPGANCSPDVSMGKMANPGDVWMAIPPPMSACSCGPGAISIVPANRCACRHCCAISMVDR